MNSATTFFLIRIADPMRRHGNSLSRAAALTALQVRIADRYHVIIEIVL
jgi:hypothetical protein